MFWTRNYCMLKETLDYNGSVEDFENKMITHDYHYTCVFELNGKTDLTPYIHLSAKGICPTVKMSHHLVNFGECKVNDHRDYIVTLENKNSGYPVDFSFAKVSHFKASPKKDVLNPGQPKSIVLTFEPKNLGKFSIDMDLELFGIYKIPIRLIGVASNLTEKTVLISLIF